MKPRPSYAMGRKHSGGRDMKRDSFQHFYAPTVYGP